jgi:hypothetical protein
MIIAITTKDETNIDDFNSPILLINTEKNTKEKIDYLESLKYADIFVTSHLDGFASEDIKKSGVTPVIYRGTIENAINDLKDCGITRELPYGENSSSCGGSCGI